MKREPAYKLFRTLFHTLTDVSFENLHVVPHSGPLILAVNHMSRIDFPMLCATDYRIDWSAFVADQYKRWKWFANIADGAGLVWIDRSKADFGAVKKALDWLKTGGMFVLAPEGTRSKTGQLLQAKPGIVMIAARAGVPVCTGSIMGTEDYKHEFLRLRKPQLTMRFSPPIQLPGIDPERRDESLRESTDEVMSRLAAMLPEKYRGYYKDYPRVRELLAEWKQDPSLIVPEG